MNPDAQPDGSDLKEPKLFFYFPFYILTKRWIAHIKLKYFYKPFRFYVRRETK